MTEEYRSVDPEDEVILLTGERSRHARTASTVTHQDESLVARILGNFGSGSNPRREDRARIFAWTHETVLSRDDLNGMTFLDANGKKIKRPGNYGSTALYIED